MTIRRRQLRSCAKAALVGGVFVAALAAPSIASAAGSGQQDNHVNPGSPAGQEYVIPIPAARSEAAGGTTGSAGGGSGGAPGGSNGAGSAGGGGSDSAAGNPPLFGVGVTPPTSGGVAGQSTGAGSTTGRPRRSHRAAAGRGSTAKAPVAPSDRSVSLASIADRSTSGSNGWLALVGGGLLVLLVGGGGGLMVRRRLSRS